MPDTFSRPSATAFSIVMPCLNEAETVGQCIDDVKKVMESQTVSYEIIIADNGSTDASASIAQAHGARVIRIPERGYGNALRGGLAAAHGDCMVMMDSDGSYSADDLSAFMGESKDGADVIMGCRFSSCGGTILPGSMPLLHRLIGNPLFTQLLRLCFRLPLHDVHCGMRAIRRSFFASLPLSQPGMEFALEFLLTSKDAGARFAEVPITLHPDGRHLHGPHLRTFRDGYRMLAFLLRYAQKKV